MNKRLTAFDPAAGLTSDEAIAALMADAFESGDAGDPRLCAPPP